MALRRAIQILYSCEKCGIKDRKISVEARADEDIRTWMENISYSLSRDHDHMSPHCKIKVLTNVKIPVFDETKIGGIK